MDEALGELSWKEKVKRKLHHCWHYQDYDYEEPQERTFKEKLFSYLVPLIILLFLSFFIGNFIAITTAVVEHHHSFFSPFSKDAPQFPPQNLTQVPLSSYWGNIEFPYPTNTNWIGSVLPGEVNSTPNYEVAVINTWPYFLHMTNEQGPSLSFIASSSQVNDCSNPYFYCVDDINGTSEYRPGATFGIPTLSTISNFSTRGISKKDLLSVTYQWGTSSGGYMECPVVSGSPYFTCIYHNLPPYLTKPVGPALQYVNGTDIAAVGQLNITTDALNWTLATAEGQGSQNWVFYTSQEVDWNCTISGCELQSSTTVPNILAIRVAHNPSDLYYQYRNIYPTGCKVEVDIHADDDDDVSNDTEDQWDKADIYFHWQVASLQTAKESEGDDGDDLMIFALPHHRQILSDFTSIQDEFSLEIGLVGNVNTVKGKTWHMIEHLSNLYWWNVGEEFSSEQTSTILSQLTLDMPTSPIMNITDPYGFGKEIARLGRLALIADEFNQLNSSTLIRQYMIESLEAALGIQYYDEIVNSDPLKYEGIYGGICSTNGLDIPGEPWGPGGAADYGNGIYNDHHYHYGYWIYGIASVIKADPDWYLNNSKLQNLILSLVRDIANPSEDDPYFTQFRYKDWYVGHSWASGLQVIADGTNQESISEAINAYYAISLLGTALNNTHLRDVGRLLMAMEIRSAQTYWQIIPSTNTIYPSSFAEFGIASQQFADKATFAVFFQCGDDVTVCAYGINIIPITPATGLLLSPSWVNETYSIYANANFTDLNQWEGFRIADYAVIDQSGAWTQALQYQPPYDNGFSLTALEHFVATRPSSSPPSPLSSFSLIFPLFVFFCILL